MTTKLRVDVAPPVRQRAGVQLVHRLISTVVATALLVPVVSTASAEAITDGPDYFATANQPTDEIAYTHQGTRTPKQRYLIGGLLAGAGVLAAAGIYFHLDSRDAADSVSADFPTGKPWSTTLASDYQRSERSRNLAIVGYSLAGGAVVAALVVLWKTTPQDERRVAGRTAMIPLAIPVDGGAVVGAQWGF